MSEIVGMDALQRTSLSKNIAVAEANSPDAVTRKLNMQNACSTLAPHPIRYRVLCGRGYAGL
jgi:hypothetical protein